MQRDYHRLEHIWDYCKSIEETVARFGDNFESFNSDKAYHDLICFYLLQIGELAGNLSEEVKTASSDRMEWAQLKGMRNIVAHHYGSIRLDIVWNTILNDIPRLKSFCEAYLETAQHDTP
jgi:uncharacterized protein with HEPN domain